MKIIPKLELHRLRDEELDEYTLDKIRRISELLIDEMSFEDGEEMEFEDGVVMEFE